MSTLPRVLDGICEVAHEYDWFVVDQWGVLHDGYTAHPGARACLQQLRRHGPVALISNTSRRVDTARAVLRRLGFTDDLYDACFTAGELAARWLEAFAAKRTERVRVCSLLRPPGPDSLLRSVDVDVVSAVEDADVVLVEGTDGGLKTSRDPALRRALERRLPLLCGNPDIRSIQPDGSFLWCPGAFAEQYAAMGGPVFQFGKPKPAIYKAARQATGGRARGLAFGDSLEHDVAGAQNAGLAAVLVTRGIHGPDLDLRPGQRPDPHAVAEIAHRYETTVDYATANFAWGNESDG